MHNPNKLPTFATQNQKGRALKGKPTKTKNHGHTKRPTQKQGAIAQLVEQRTENPCVPGSIPGGTTE